ncbi:MAG: fibrobacter succinogenes major paralogous domain-containing protein, partial [Bacteroidales bacterium]|nr:fibrobacter succinogenes major paralogous domain-containing protein [Bacteroidales bacterium]
IQHLAHDTANKVRTELATAIENFITSDSIQHIAHDTANKVRTELATAIENFITSDSIQHLAHDTANKVRTELATAIENFLSSDSIQHLAHDTANVLRKEFKTAIKDFLKSDSIQQLVEDSLKNYAKTTDLPTVNDNTITIQKNGVDVDNFTLNASSDKAINITVPTTVAELSDANTYLKSDSIQHLVKDSLANYAKTSSLATVATTGSYNDLTDQPTIPSTVAELSDASNYALVAGNNSFTGTNTFSSTAGFSSTVTVPQAVNTTTLAYTNDEMQAVSYKDIMFLFDSIQSKFNQMQKVIDSLAVLVNDSRTVPNVTNLYITPHSNSMDLEASIAIGGSALTARYFYYSTVNDIATAASVSSASNNVTITGLSQNTTYYIWVVASNSIGTDTSAVFSATTKPDIPSISNFLLTSTDNGRGIIVTADVNLQGASSATLNIKYVETGETDTLTSSSTITSSINDTITSLNIATGYTVIIAVNNGADVPATQSGTVTTYGLPTVASTTAASSITYTTAVSGDNVTASGGASVIRRGVCWVASPAIPTIANDTTIDGSGTGIFTSTLKDLTASTTYNVRAYATTPVGTAYGPVQTCTTVAGTLPSITLETSSTDAYSYNSIVCEAEITSAGSEPIIETGFCYSSTNSTPRISDNVWVNSSTSLGNIYDTIRGLTTNTTYYVYAYATSNVGTAYSTVKTITLSFTCGISQISDYNNNLYNTVAMGTQCWLKENLRSTNYANGDVITPAPTTSITSNIVGYYYHVAGNSANDEARGLIYNWYAVMHGSASSNAEPSGVQGICPDGWHVPSHTEFNSLINYVNSIPAYKCNSTDLYIAKALASTQYFSSTSTVACTAGNDLASNNATGFSMVPVGSEGSYQNRSAKDATIWSSTTANNNSDNAYFLRVDYAQPKVNWIDQGQKEVDAKSHAYAVRCVFNDTIPFPTPDVRTAAVSNITTNTALAGGRIADNAIYVTESGVCYSTSNTTPTISNTKVVIPISDPDSNTFTSTLTSLEAGQTYYLRAYAISITGTFYGEAVSFTTVAPFVCGTSTISDYDNNVYNTVQIDGQCWLKENLRTTHYSDGTAVPLGSGYSATDGYYLHLEDNASNDATYGLLYNYKAVMNGASSINAVPSGVQGICPTGWHVPSRAEFENLLTYLYDQNEYYCNGNSSDIAKSLASTTTWNSSIIPCAVGNDPSANNATGFSAVAAGGWFGNYFNKGIYAELQTTTSVDTSVILFRLHNDSSSCYMFDTRDISDYFPVRCLRD